LPKNIEFYLYIQVTTILSVVSCFVETKSKICRVNLTGFRGWGGFRGRHYDRNNETVADDVTANNRDEPN